MRIAICEDDPLHAQILADMIAHWQKTESGQKEVVKIEIFLSAEQLLCSKEESFSFDLAFLDIGLKQMDGLELARHLRAQNEQIILVFTTADALSAAKGYEVEAFRYLVKPLHLEQVEDVLTQVCQKLQKNKKDALVVLYDGKMHRIWKQDILFLEASGHYLEIHTQEKTVRVRAKLDEFEAELSGFQFCRCHRAFLCNLYYAEQIDKDAIWMTNGVRIPISRSRQHEVNECMIAYYTNVRMTLEK